MTTSSFSDFRIVVPTGTRGEIRTVCPECSPKRKKSRDPCLSVNVSKGCWHCWHCGWRGTLAGASVTHPPAFDPMGADKLKREQDRARRRLNKLWSDSLPLTDSRSELALTYLQARGLGDLIERGDLPARLRYYPRLPYWDTAGAKPRLIGCFPALLAKVSDSRDQWINVHRTYLAADGKSKAPVSAPKKLEKSLNSGASTGAAIRLYPAADAVAVAEGIETVLSIRVARPDLPCWSCVCDSGLAGVILPASIRWVLVAADHDRSGAGQRAARVLAERLKSEGRRLRFLLPPKAGIDWNTILMEGAA